MKTNFPLLKELIARYKAEHDYEIDVRGAEYEIERADELIQELLDMVSGVRPIPPRKIEGIIFTGENYD